MLQSRVSLTKINIGAVKRIIFIFNNKLDFKKFPRTSAEKHHHSLTILSVQAEHVVGHTRRSRGSQSGREKRRDGIFQAPENWFHGTLGSPRMVVGTLTQQLFKMKNFPSLPPPCSFDMLGSTIASSKLSTHPSPNSTLTQTSKRMAKCQVNGGAGGDLCRDIKTYANPFPSLTLKLTSLVCNKCRVKGGVGGPFTRISYSQYYCLG